MQTFIQKHSSKVIGVLSGFDRLVFQGQALGLCTGERLSSLAAIKNVGIQRIMELAA